MVSYFVEDKTARVRATTLTKMIYGRVGEEGVGNWKERGGNLGRVEEILRKSERNLSAEGMRGVVVCDVCREKIGFFEKCDF